MEERLDGRPPMTGPLGAFTFVLHSHLPYARMAGRWPHGEEWIHEAAADTYVPLLSALHDLMDEGVPYRLTLGVTPVLAEQLADPDVLRNFEDYLRDLQGRADSDIARFEREGDDQRGGLARFHADRFGWLIDQFAQRFGRDIIGGFRRLQDAGRLEIATSAATHGYLPLFERDSSIHAQVATGVRTYERHFGRAPESFWLPECAYRPHRDGRAGLETFLAEAGLTTFFVETQTILGGHAIGKAVGPYEQSTARDVAASVNGEPAGERTTFQPYWVGGQRVAAIGRNYATGQQVWSGEHGYPGDFWYREFHRKDAESGLHYWRVTGARVDLGEKQLYHPGQAAERVHEHAGHFAALVEAQAAKYATTSGEFGLVSAAYDTELFGHWWFEGVSWLKEVLRLLSASETVALTGAAEFVRDHPPEEVVELPEGSWGQQGTHVVWMNADTQWMWPLINGAQRRMELIVAEQRSAPPAALAQLGRELLLLESSDWPFLVTTGQARQYAELRFTQHLERFEVLAGQIEAGTVDPGMLADMEERDKLFPDIDVTDFADRQAEVSAAGIRSSS
jgi:1,4-alpha-glucan branching enzyme